MLEDLWLLCREASGGQGHHQEAQAGARTGEGGDLVRRGTGEMERPSVFCGQATGLANELDVGVRSREESMAIPNLWFGKLADGDTIRKTEKKGGLREGEKWRMTVRQPWE